MKNETLGNHRTHEVLSMCKVHSDSYITSLLMSRVKMSEISLFLDSEWDIMS